MAKKKKIDSSNSIQQNQYVLPSNNKELTNFIKSFKPDMMNHVVSSINDAIRNNQQLVELFQFKNSPFVITVNVSTFKSNVQNALDYFLQNEIYEYCKLANQTLQLIDDYTSSLNNSIDRNSDTNK